MARGEKNEIWKIYEPGGCVVRGPTLGGTRECRGWVASGQWKSITAVSVPLQQKQICENNINQTAALRTGEGRTVRRKPLCNQPTREGKLGHFFIQH